MTMEKNGESFYLSSLATYIRPGRLFVSFSQTAQAIGVSLPFNIKPPTKSILGSGRVGCVAGDDESEGWSRGRITISGMNG
jgi:hypothetical protein